MSYQETLAQYIDSKDFLRAALTNPEGAGNVLMAFLFCDVDDAAAEVPPRRLMDVRRRGGSVKVKRKDRKI